MGNITFHDLIKSHGREIANRALEYGRHFLTGGRWPDPFWSADGLDEVLALMTIEDERAEGK
jgi:hypothetical protein